MAGGRHDRQKPRAKLVKIAHFFAAPPAESIEVSDLPVPPVSSVSFARSAGILPPGFLFPPEACFQGNVNRHRFQGEEQCVSFSASAFLVATWSWPPASRTESAYLLCLLLFLDEPLFFAQQQFIDFCDESEQFYRILLCRSLFAERIERSRFSRIWPVLRQQRKFKWSCVHCRYVGVQGRSGLVFNRRKRVMEKRNEVVSPVMRALHPAALLRNERVSYLVFVEFVSCKTRSYMNKRNGVST
jgi:hypothetical protein